MSQSLLIRKLPMIEYLFLFAVILGPAAAFSKFYLFHLVLFILVARSFVSIKWDNVRWRDNVTAATSDIDLLFFMFFIVWYFSSVAWAADKLYAMQYCAYVVMGILTVYYTLIICRSLERLRAALMVIVGTLLVQVVLAVMEGLRLIRLPFSPYSPHQWIFGREPSSFEGLGPEQIEKILAAPTGFMGNPNNLAAFLVLALPLFLFSRRWWAAASGVAATYFIINMADARAAMIGFWVVLVLGTVLYAGHRRRTAMISAVLAVIAIGGPLLPNWASPPGREVVASMETYDAALNLADGILSGQSQGSDSVGIRTRLILNGLEALRQSRGLGVGAGGSLTVQKQSSDPQIAHIGSMHNFWVELLVDGGVLFAAIFFLWSGWLVWRLWQVGRAAEEPLLRYLGKALSLGFLGFVFGAIGPSSIIYMLPMWLMIGLALAVVRLITQGAAAGSMRDTALARA